MNKIILALLTLWLVTGCTSTLTKNDTGLVGLRNAAEQDYQNKNYDSALSKYLELIDAVPNDPLFWHRLGNTYAHKNQPELAIKAYERAVSIDPKFAKSWHNMGILELRRAANSFTQMLRLIEPNDPLFDRAERLTNGVLGILAPQTKDAPTK